MRKTTIKVPVGRLIAALEDKKAAAVATHGLKVEEYQQQLDKVLRGQKYALIAAADAVRDGRMVEVARYSDSEASDGYFMLRLPQAVYQPRLDVDRFQRAIDILKVADPDSLVTVGTDDEYSRLLSG